MTLKSDNTKLRRIRKELNMVSKKEKSLMLIQLHRNKITRSHNKVRAPSKTSFNVFFWIKKLQNLKTRKPAKQLKDKKKYFSFILKY